MSAQAPKCSDITLPEFGRLINDLIQKLTGQKAKFWLKSFKKFLRKENPWIPFEIIMKKGISNPANSGNWQFLIQESLKALANMGMHIFDGFLEKVACPPVVQILDQDVAVVSVRLGDMLSLEEIARCTYSDILSAAEEKFDFVPCDHVNGLVAISILVKMIKGQSSNKAPLVNYVICSEVVKVGDLERLPSIAVWYGDKSYLGEQDRQGMITLSAIEMVGHPSLLLFRDPDLRLLFLSAR
jgi:hypothetical protein